MLKKIVLTALLTTVSLIQAETELMVSAAASLKNVFTEISTNFEKIHPGTKVILNFAASGQLQAQIESGAPVDVFASASTKEINSLVEKKLIAQGSVQNFAANEIVLIKNSNSKISIKSLADLKSKSVQKIAIGNKATVPAGKYAMQTVAYYKLEKDLQDKFIACETVRQVLDYVERNEVDAGFVFSTDAKIGKNIEIVTNIAPDAHDKIVYPISIIKSTKSNKLAGEFIDFVIKSKSTLKKYGFKE